MPRIPKPSPALAVAVVALVAALGGVAIASPIGSDGKVHLCYSQAALDDPGNGSSAVYVVNADKPCDGDYPDTVLVDQTGPRGLPGPPGVSGVTGLQGPAGPPGLPGGIGDKLKDQALGGLGAVEKKSNATENRLEDARSRLAELIRRRGSVDPDALAKEQARLLQLIASLTNQVQDMNDVNQKVIRKLAG